MMTFARRLSSWRLHFVGPCAVVLCVGVSAAPGLAAPADNGATVLSAPSEIVATPDGVLASSDSAPSVEFMVGSQTLLLRLAAGVVPVITELRSPPELVITIPGTDLAPGRAAFGNGLVTRYEITHLGNSTRAVLSLRTPLTRRPVLGFYEGRVVIAVVPELAPAPEQIVPAAIMSPFPTAKPHPVPVPTASGPNYRVTPVPIPTGTGPLPLPRDIPPIRQGAAALAGDHV
jgi:hypothetical protein